MKLGKRTRAGKLVLVKGSFLCIAAERSNIVLLSWATWVGPRWGVAVNLRCQRRRFNVFLHLVKVALTQWPIGNVNVFAIFDLPHYCFGYVLLRQNFLLVAKNQIFFDVITQKTSKNFIFDCFLFSPTRKDIILAVCQQFSSKQSISRKKDQYYDFIWHTGTRKKFVYIL